MGVDLTALLVSAGVASGLAGSIAGLASLFSYPALLAVGLLPVAANVTNTVALFSNTVGTAAGSRAELRGQRDRLLRLGVIAALGGAVGAALLLGTPSSAFETVVPWLIALGSVLILVRDPLRRLVASRSPSPARTARPTLPLACAVLLVGLYGGYFGGLGRPDAGGGSLALRHGAPPGHQRRQEHRDRRRQCDGGRRLRRRRPRELGRRRIPRPRRSPRQLARPSGRPPPARNSGP
ncbi:hypothetical protein SANTM175S_11021 [Streptomyces antimycoticus]